MSRARDRPGSSGARGAGRGCTHRPAFRLTASVTNAMLAPMRHLASILILCAFAAPATAQERAVVAAKRAVYLDNEGVVRWRDDRNEVALFGANYILPSASDYRAAGYLGADRKKMIDDDMAHFARMGWDGLRLTLWGDWENSDRAGNLI